MPSLPGRGCGCRSAGRRSRPVRLANRRRYPPLAYWSTFTIRSVVSDPGETTSATSSTCSGRVGVTSIVSARYTTTSGRRLVSGTSCRRASKSVSAFHSGPDAASSAFARTRANRLCRLDALGLTTAMPATISIRAQRSSGQESYSAAVTCWCIYAPTPVSTLMTPAPPEQFPTCSLRLRRIDADTEICCGEQKQLRKERELPRRQPNMPRVGGCPEVIVQTSTIFAVFSHSRRGLHDKFTGGR